AFSRSIVVVVNQVQSTSSSLSFSSSPHFSPYRLSEASKLLRRLEKGLNSAKPKVLPDSAISSPYPLSDSRTSPSDPTHYAGMMRPDNYSSFHSNFSSIELP